MGSLGAARWAGRVTEGRRRRFGLASLVPPLVALACVPSELDSMDLAEHLATVSSQERAAVRDLGCASEGHPVCWTSRSHQTPESASREEADAVAAEEAR